MNRSKFAVALLGCILGVAQLGAQPVLLEFASAEVAGRGVHALRLFLDTTGPARVSDLEILLPKGAHFLRPAPAQVRLGEGAPAVLVLHLFVTEVVPAGPLEIQGRIRDLGSEVALVAVATVRSAPGFHVRLPASDLHVGLEGKPVELTAVVQNTGNAVLQIHATAPTGSDGPVVTMNPAQFQVAPGGEQKVGVRLRAPGRSMLSTEHTVACLFAATANDYQRSEQVIVRAVFVPQLLEPGSLFASLQGSAEVGVAAIEGRGEMIAQFDLAGEIKPGVMLAAYGVDGAMSLLGSQLGLARRDTWHVGLTSAEWHATAGEARGPSLGSLEPVAYGRGLAAGMRRSGWSGDAFALRDAFAGSVREAAGVKFAGPADSWETGISIQRNQQQFEAATQRASAFVGGKWGWSRVRAITQVAVAQPEESGAKVGFVQAFGYNGKRLRVDARYENAEEGFFLQDQSSENISVLAEWNLGRGWSVFGGANQTAQTGRLRTLLEDLNNQGRPADPAGVVELINQVASRQDSVRAGLGRQFAAGTLWSRVTHQKRSGELDLKQLYSEDAFELEWTSGASAPWWRAGTTVGREMNDSNSSQFAEFQGAMYWHPTARTRIEGNVRWTNALSGTPDGFRREGRYGQLAAGYQPARGWSADIYADGYDYKDYASRSKLGAVMRFPLGRSGWSGAVEHTREIRSGYTATWFVFRAPLSIQMPWRPIKGTVGGRIVDRASGAGLPDVMVQSGRQRALTDANGRFQLPAMEPADHPIRFQVPGSWTPAANWPESVRVEAGRRDTLELEAEKLAVFSGEVVVTNSAGQTRPAPAGVVVAEDARGRRHEALVFNGTFSMSLPPGRYKVSFVSELPEELNRQFSQEIEISDGTVVRLEAREQERRIRRTLALVDGSAGRN